MPSSLRGSLTLMTSGYAIATLVVFVISIFFVIRPVKIPMPRRIPPIPINLTTAPILAIAILWATRCLDPAVIRDGIVGTESVKPYNTLILFFSLAYMAVTLDITGILEAATYWLSNKCGRNGWRLYLHLYILFTLLSILCNYHVVLTGTAFLSYYTKVAGLNPTAWITAEFAAANTASMVLFVGNPTNVVICEGFSVNNTTYTAYTIIPFLACSMFCFAALALQYRKQVPRVLSHATEYDPRLALRDPIGAIFGSFMLGTTLILCLVMSFFGIDVWMISLPFAVGKFIFDIGWDHYRYLRGTFDPGALKTLEDRVGASLPAVTQPTLDHSLHPPLPIDGKLLMSLLTEQHASVDSQICTKVDSDTEPSHHTDKGPLVGSQSETQGVESAGEQSTPIYEAKPDLLPQSRPPFSQLTKLKEHFPTFFTALPRLPFALVPFAFSQFILIEALSHQGWVNIFAGWLVRACHDQIHPTIWLIGVLGVVLCNVAGTNIGATILLTKVVRAAALSDHTNRAAAIALAVASNIGAVGFTLSASLAGLLWQSTLTQKGIPVRQKDFALQNLLPLFLMTVVGLGVVSAEMAVLYR